ncbi:MAG: diacylglycerol kinase family lipid kinase [Verrucomicrobia bacterium]|nr:diacylglycerol kinase family lipid kinase [Verrucomicrobiota bacterium]NBR62731.1 diacylglycerol kinase family lipid kinase [Verrucomicrobiota bacterium]
MSTSSSNPWCIILNPAAKGDQARKTIDRMGKLAPEAKILLTENPGDGEHRAREAVAMGFQTIVAAGGDGTVNEVLNGIDPARCALGILPVGTMNVLALELGISPDLERALAVIRAGRRRQIDLGYANQRRFIQLAGVGLDAEVVKKTHPEAKRAWGPWSYLLTVAQVTVAPAPHLKVKSGGQEYPGAMVLIGNGRHYGGPFRFFPKANMSDGKLDVCIFPKSGPLDLLWYLQGVLLGGPESLPEVQYLQTPALTVEAKEKVALEVDGEFGGETPVAFRLEKKGVEVIVP